MEDLEIDSDFTMLLKFLSKFNDVRIHTIESLDDTIEFILSKPNSNVRVNILTTNHKLTNIKYYAIDSEYEITKKMFEDLESLISIIINCGINSLNSNEN